MRQLLRRPEQDVIDRIDELVEWELTQSPAAKIHAHDQPLQWLDEAWRPGLWQMLKDIGWIILRLAGLR